MFDRSSVRRQTAPVSSANSLVPLRVQAVHSKLETPTAKPVPAPPLTDITSLLRGALLESPLQLCISEEELRVLYLNWPYFELQEGQLVFEEGFPGSLLYVVHFGQVRISSNQVHMRTVNAGQCFGGLSPCFGSTRMASAYSSTRSRLWTVGLQDLRGLERKAKASVLPTLTPTLESMSWMQCLSARKRQVFLDTCLLLHFRQGQQLLRQGARGSLVFFVVAGQVQVSQGNKAIRTLGAGEVLGEQSALYTNTCTASITALCDVHCLALDKNHLQIIFSLSLSHFIYKNSVRIAFDRSASLGPLSLEQKEALLPHVKVCTYAYDEVVIGEGTRFNEGLWVVLQGNLVAKDQLREEESYVVAEFCCINDDIVLETDDQGCFTHDVVANCEEVAVGFLPLSSLRTAIGSAFRLPVCIGTEEIVADLPFLQGFSAKQVEMLCRLAEPRVFQPNEVLAETIHTSSLCLLRKGSVLLLSYPQPSKELTAPSHFGSGSSNRTSVLSSVTVVQTAQCLLLSRTHFRAIFGEQSQASVERLLDSQTGAGLLLSELTIVRRYEKLRTGSMYLVTDSEGREYGLKRICRKKIKSLFMSAKLRNEREIMCKLFHPLITRLIRTFRDTHYVYFLRDFVHGLMLSDLLPRRGRLEEAEALVYVAMVIWILEYLHGLGVMHRDVNPESFLVDGKGYLRLVDLGSACVAERACSVAGSPHYIAPEVLKGEGYSKTADLWSLGVMSFELLHGRVPYGDSEEDPYLVFEAVLKGPLPPPDSALSPNCQSFLLSLLNQDPIQRGSIEKAKQHPWLQDFPWAELTSQRLEPALKPLETSKDQMTSPSRLRKHFPFEPGEMSPARRNKRRVTMSGDWSSEF